MRVVSPDGTSLSAQEWGNPGGIEVLFIHGFCQSHLSWMRQLHDPALAQRFRMVCFDLRGHGNSDKPETQEGYEANHLWGNDVAAVIAAFGLRRPYLVAWSYGGRVIADYLATHGPGGIAGINYVNARCSNDVVFYGESRHHLTGMRSDDLATNIRSTRAFLRACFERQPEAADFETMLAFNMMVPVPVRRYVLGRKDETTDALSTLDCPVLVTHGRSDGIILTSMAEFITAHVRGATLSFYDGIGHAPFFEDAPRFNAELISFIEAAEARKHARSHG